MKPILIILSIIHVIEEYLGGFIPYVNQFAEGITWLHFIIINLLFIVYVIIALFSKKPVLILSVPFLFMVNAIIHISGLILFKEYNPGVISAIFFYLPFSIIFIKKNNPDTLLIAKSLALAVFLMTIPFIFQAARILTETIRK